MNKFKYTENWFADFPQGFFDERTNPKDELHFLEIGSYEGKSTVWFLDNLLHHAKSTITCIDPWLPYTQVDNKKVEFDLKGIKNNFLHNIKMSGQADKVIVKEGLSGELLLDPHVRSKKYDLIFIDGNHTAKFVLEDAVLSWGLLKMGGIMVFDDYLWMVEHSRKRLRPKMAIDSFCDCYGDYLKVIHQEYRLALKKIKE